MTVCNNPDYKVKHQISCRFKSKPIYLLDTHLSFTEQITKSDLQALYRQKKVKREEY